MRRSCGLEIEENGWKERWEKGVVEEEGGVAEDDSMMSRTERRRDFRSELIKLALIRDSSRPNSAVDSL